MLTKTRQHGAFEQISIEEVIATHKMLTMP